MLDIRKIKSAKGKRRLQVLTCYDYQMARLLSETDLDMILVGDSLANVILGYDSTVPVSLDEMKIFTAAVVRGAHHAKNQEKKFVVSDLPFGTYATFESGINNAIELFQYSGANALKLEGASEMKERLIEALGEAGIPVMGHIGLIPQSINVLGGHFRHGKTPEERERLLNEAIRLERAGVFSIVLEMVDHELASEISAKISIPTIGIGSGENVDGQVLVSNDLLGLGPDKIPSFCQPIANLFAQKKALIQSYLNEQR